MLNLKSTSMTSKREFNWPEVRNVVSRQHSRAAHPLLRAPMLLRAPVLRSRLAILAARFLAFVALRCRAWIFLRFESDIMAMEAVSA